MTTNSVCVVVKEKLYPQILKASAIARRSERECAAALCIPVVDSHGNPDLDKAPSLRGFRVGKKHSVEIIKCPVDQRSLDFHTHPRDVDIGALNFSIADMLTSINFNDLAMCVGNKKGSVKCVSLETLIHDKDFVAEVRRVRHMERSVQYGWANQSEKKVFFKKAIELNKRLEQQACVFSFRERAKKINEKEKKANSFKRNSD